MELWKIHYNNIQKSILFLNFVLVIFIISVNSQISLPSEQDGFWYGDQIDKSKSILIEAFFDPVCPDSRDTWPPLKKALHHYGSRVSLLLHTFPLPYHDNAFISSRALHIVDKLNTSATYRLLEAFFDQQDKFYSQATFNLSKASVVDEVAKFTSNAIGNSNYDAVKAGFSDPKTDQATRISFKYGCVKGVYGTPFFFVNGFPLPDAGSSLDYKTWRNILDPLFSPEGQLRTENSHFFLRKKVKQRYIMPKDFYEPLDAHQSSSLKVPKDIGGVNSN